MVPDRLWYHTDRVIRSCLFSYTSPAMQLPGRSSVICGELQDGRNSICMFDWSALMIPQKATLDSMRTLS
jgi:hypothetical protein